MSSKWFLLKQKYPLKGGTVSYRNAEKSMKLNVLITEGRFKRSFRTRSSKMNNKLNFKIRGRYIRHLNNVILPFSILRLDIYTTTSVTLT